MQDLASRLQKKMLKDGVTQAALARELSVSQSSISRALRRAPVRYSKATRALCDYAGIDDQEISEIVLSTKPSATVILKTFQSVWDGTEAHADAIAKIIAATRGLRPKRK